MKLSKLIADAQAVLAARGDIEARITSVPAPGEVSEDATELVMDARPEVKDLALIRLTVQVENTPRNQKAICALRDTLFTADVTKNFDGRLGCMKLESVTVRDFMVTKQFQLEPKEPETKAEEEE